jgi:hypothetical protein
MVCRILHAVIDTDRETTPIRVSEHGCISRDRRLSQVWAALRVGAYSSGLLA